MATFPKFKLNQMYQSIFQQQGYYSYGQIMIGCHDPVSILTIIIYTDIQGHCLNDNMIRKQLKVINTPNYSDETKFTLVKYY